MQVLSLKDISKEDGFLYYMKKYKAIAVLELISKEYEMPVQFSVETGPLGDKNIEFEDFSKQLDYPVLPVLKCLKEHVSKMIKDGTLP